MTLPIQNFIDQRVQKCAPLEKQLCELYWKLATTGEPRIAQELVEKEKEMKILFSNPEEFRQLKKWGAEGISDPILERQIDLLIKAYTPNQLDEKTIADLVERSTEIENIFNNFRSELDGKKITNNDLKEILKKEKDNDRRQKVWEASKQIAPEVSEKVRELVRRRNKAAQKLGFPNHFEMSMTLQELDSLWLLQLFAELKQATQKTFEKKIKKLHQKLGQYYGVAAEEVMPWHYDDPFAQDAPSQVTVDLDPYLEHQDILKACRDFYQSIDLDIADVLERSDLYERKGKSQHAFCINMNRGTDVRILGNIRKNQYWASTMLHELGHAAYSKNINPNLPYFLRDEAHIFATEAIAMLMERMIHHPDWLQRGLGASPKEAQNLKATLWDSLDLDKLIIARWTMLVSTFESALYNNPDQDLNGLWWKLVEDFQLISKPAGRNHPDWAAKIHIASHPCYYQNYLLGELMAAQIAETLEKEAMKKSLKETSFYGFPAIGKLLKERLFQMGQKWSWNKLVPHVTGQELNFQSFVNQFC